MQAVNGGGDPDQAGLDESALPPLPTLTALLPPAETEFLVLADTHLVDTRAGHAREFASRMKQNDRVAVAMRVAKATGDGTLMHLGDLVQDYPDSPLHEGLLMRAVRQLRKAAPDVRIAAGNTDVGDQHDPSSPAVLVSQDSIKRFSSAADAAFTGIDIGPVRALVLMASLFNSGLEAEEDQWRWLERELATAERRRIALFFHYPLFLRTAEDPDVGNYDVVNEPARSRLINLIGTYGVEAVFTGHSHFAFFNRIGRARAYGTPSTSFTRPGFSELFSSDAPPDRGRDDVPKLGFMLARIHDDDIRVHFVRTGPMADRPEERTVRPVLSCAPKDIPGSRLGVVLRHPLAGFAEVPDTFPSVIRQPVRNDYPLLSCLELGARHVSISVADVHDPELADRVRVLRDEGVSITARVVWPADQPLVLPDASAPVDEIEVVLLDRTTPTMTDIGELAAVRPGRRLLLSTLTRRTKAAAELPRWRYGLTIGEASELDGVLSANRVQDLRLLICLDHLDEPGQVIEFMRRHAWRSVDGVDVVTAVRGAGVDEAGRLTESFLTACAGGSIRFFVDGLTELDRTLDLSAGLLDRACNPRPSFHALRILNSLVHGEQVATINREDGEFRVTRGDLSAVISISGERPGDISDVREQADVISLADGLVLVSGPRTEAPGPLMWLRTVT